MNDDIKVYSKKVDLIDKEGWTQIIMYTVIQLLLIFFVTFIGPMFIPESIDEVDLIIGNDWIAKYSDSTKSTISSGLPFSINRGQELYTITF